MVPYKFQLCLVIGTVLFFASGESQTLTLSEPVKQPDASECVGSLADGKEYFYIEGQADLSTASDPNEWNNLIINFENKRKDGSSFTSIGSLDITKGCNGYQTDTVYCNNSTSDVYNIVFNSTAYNFMSGATIRARWTSKGYNIISSKNRTAPDINSAVQPDDKVTCDDGATTQLVSQSSFSFVTGCTSVEFCIDASPPSSYNVTFSANGLQMKTSNTRCISSNKCANGNLKIAFGYDRDDGCVRKKLYTGIILANGPFQGTILVVMMVVSCACGTIIILLGWTYKKWIVWCPCCGGKNKDITTKPDSRGADSSVEINRLPPLNSPPPASANGTKPKPTTTTTSDEDRTKKKRKKNKVTGGESEKKNTEKETPEKETPEKRKTPEKKQRKTKKAGESDEGAEQTDQVRPLPSPRMVGEPGFNTSSTSPVNLRSNFSASLAHQGIKSDTRPPSIEVTTRALPKPKKK